MTRHRSDPLVVIPAYDEAACIAEVIAEVTAHGYDCVVVDDGSSDDTADIARDAGAPVVQLPINLGVGGALRAGFRYAVTHGYRSVVQVDADGQHISTAIADLVTAGADADLVIGSRFLSGDHPPVGAVRKAAMRMLGMVVRRSTGVTVSDPTSGFRLVRSPLLEGFADDFPHHYLGDTFEALLVAARRGYRITEVPVPMRARQGGTPSADTQASVRAMVRAITVLLTGTTFELPPRPQHEPSEG